MSLYVTTHNTVNNKIAFYMKKYILLMNKVFRKPHKIVAKPLKIIKSPSKQLKLCELIFNYTAIKTLSLCKNNLKYLKT